MTEIRHIVFDIGKVLIHYDPNLPFSRIIPDAGMLVYFSHPQVIADLVILLLAMPMLLVPGKN